MGMAEKFGDPCHFYRHTRGLSGHRREERGQAEAIALNLREMARLRVPIISGVLGEGVGRSSAIVLATVW